MAKTSLVVLSGGLDSTVLLHNVAKSKKEQARAIYFDIGYLSSTPEKNAAKMFCYKTGIALEIVNVRGIFDMVTGFVPIELLGLGELDKGQPTPVPKTANSVDKDYVSGFHVILSLASYYAMLGRIDTIYAGIIKEQIQYSKGLKAFLNSWAANIEKLNPNRPFMLETPFASVSKADVIKIGLDNGVEIERTWSCYRAGPLHCGICNGCLSRKQGFKKAAIDDPTTYSSPI